MRIPISIFIFFLCANTLFAQQYWITQSTPVNTWLNSCSFPDSLNGWAAGEDGVIIHTSNGGSNWVIQNSTIDFFINKIKFIDPLHGWAIANDVFGNGTAILSTTDGGNNWSMTRYPDTTQFFYSVDFANPATGWLCGFNGGFAKTTDGGNTWTPAGRDSSFHSSLAAYNISMYNDQYGFACGGIYDLGGTLWRTTDGGNYWSSYPAGIEPFRGIHYFDSLSIVAVGGDLEFGATLSRTTNGGQNWDYNPLNIFGIAYAVSFRTPGEGWICLSFAETLLRTTDGGYNWTVHPTPHKAVIYDLVFVDEMHGWAVGTEGTVLKYDPTSNITQSGTNIPAYYDLKQNYPNPFNPATNIEYSVPMRSHIRLEVYDITGKLITTLIDGIKDPGTHITGFKADNLPSGIYLYRLTTPTGTLSRKMLLLK